MIKSTNLKWAISPVNRSMREGLLNQKGCTIWFTGLPSSGKTTTAFALEQQLIRQNKLAYVLDGDNIRHGLNRDLGFSAQDRAENIRRIGEVSKLLADAGVVVISSFISPYIEHRDFVRKIHLEAKIGFLEVYINTPLKVCEARDPKGNYKKARRGELKGFTGVDDPYEPPISPELLIDTCDVAPEQLAGRIVSLLIDRGYVFSEKIYNPSRLVIDV